ncbi:quinon protein alcohol dehydrogenase-like superfamily [Trichoderma pleuroticola]
MANIRKISGNTIGSNVIIVQGDLNTDFLNQIAQTDPFYDRKRILELKGPFLHESFNWILDHKGFEKWRCTRESGVLWIKGDPGKGKTMLLCGIINELEEDPGINVNLSYFFCQATDSRINTATSVIGSLMISFIKRVRNFLSFIHEKYGDKLDQLNGPNGWNILCDLFTDVTLSPVVSDPVCIVDALDECEHDSKSLLSIIVKTSGHVKWLISSRNVKDVERGLRLIEPGRMVNLELKENAERISKSVDIYINNSVVDIYALEDDEELRTKTTKVLKEKANGTFLWVALVIGQLRDTDHRHVEEVLEEMPEGLESLYGLIMKRAHSRLRQKDRETCRMLLSIVTTAERPLHLEELHIFISSQLGHYNAAYNRQDMNDIARDCGPLFSSVKDYMAENATEYIFPLGIEYQHFKMAETSLSAMSRGLKHDMYDLKDPKSKMTNITPPNPDPLKHIEYFCLFWVEHLLHGGSKTGELFIDDGIIHTFLKVKYLCWLESLALLHRLLSHGPRVLHLLKKLTVSYYRGKANENLQREDDTVSLRTFIDDAYHFFHLCKDYVREWPLQLYFSAIVFEDSHSAISRTFRQIVHPKIGEPLGLITKPQKRFSLLHDIKLEGYIERMFYSRNSSSLCVLSDHGIASLYEADTGSLKRAIKICPEHNGYGSKFPEHVAFTPDSRGLVSVSHTGLVRTWTDDGALVHQNSLSLEVGEDVDTSGLNFVVIIYNTSSNKARLMRIWITRTGVRMCEIDLIHIPGLFNGYLTVFISPNSALMALIYKVGAIIYSTQKGKELKHIHGPIMEAGTSSKFSPCSKLLALVYGSVIHIWSKIAQFDFSPDAKVFMATSSKALIFGNTTTGEKLFEIPTPLVASSYSGGVRIWRIDTVGKQVSRIPHTSNAISVAISPKSIYVATFMRFGGDIIIWSGESGQPVQTLKRGDVMWTCPVFSPNSELIAYEDGTRGDVKIWSINTRKSLHLLKGPNEKFTWPTMAFSSDSKHLLVGHVGGEVRVWCVESGKCLYKNKEKHDGSRFRTDSPKLVMSHNSKYIAVAYRRQDWDVWRVCIWNWRADHCVSRFNINRHTRSFTFSSDDKILAVIYAKTESYKYEVQLWTVATGICLSCFTVGQSYSAPLFDSVADQILTDRFSFRQNSSLKHWEKFPRRGYSLFYENDDGQWLCVRGERSIYIPREFSLGGRNASVVSASLLAIVTPAYGLVIIQLPELA